MREEFLEFLEDKMVKDLMEMRIWNEFYDEEEEL